jgi:aminoglycoside/choline kinase family phosphotransferase
MDAGTKPPPTPEVAAADAADRAVLSCCFEALSGGAPTSCTVLRPHASQRRLYRLRGAKLGCVGVVNAVLAENDAFVYFAGQFRGAGLPVPEVYRYQREEGAYLQQDLGDTTLLDLLTQERARTGEDFPFAVARVYRQVLELLPRFQIELAAQLDFSKCYPNSDFACAALRADFQACADQLIARLLPSYDRTRLQGDFATLIDFLSTARGDFFLYRDCQSRNVMVVEGEPYFIDFQGGRRGPLQYDVVSLLYQASAQLSPEVRSELTEHYIQSAQRHTPLDREDFLHYMSGFVVSRMLQVLGVYGREGLGAGKEYFAASIPSAVRTLAQQLDDTATLPIQLPELRACCAALQGVV